VNTSREGNALEVAAGGCLSASLAGDVAPLAGFVLAGTSVRVTVGAGGRGEGKKKSGLRVSEPSRQIIFRK